MANRVKDHWPHMNLVWPTYDYTKHNLVLFYLDEKGETTVAWNINTKGISELKPEEYKDIIPPQPGGYSEIKFQDKKSIAMSYDSESIDNMKEEARETYLTASHELVHFYYQEIDAEGSRSQPYPIEKEPRIYRKMLMKNLVDAYKNPKSSEKSLSQARYWLDKWKSEFKEEYEAIKSTDIAEGTARYTENLSAFIKDGLKKEQIKKEATKYIKLDEVFLSADGESYEVGYVAALLLDEKSPNWKKDFYKSKLTLEEALLKDVKPLKEAADKKIETTLSKKIEEHKKQTDADIANVTKALSDKSVPYLKIDKTKSASSFTAEGMYAYKGKAVVTNFSTVYGVKDKSIKIDKTSIIEEYSENSDVILVPLTMNSKLENGKLTVESENVKVNGVEVKQEKDSDGRIIYSVKIDK